MENISKKFISKNYIISTIPDNKNYNIKKDLEELLVGLGNRLCFYRDELLRLFGDINFTNSEIVSGRVHESKDSIAVGDFVSEARRSEIYGEYSLGQALLLISLLPINKICEPIHIYLKERKGDISYCFRIFRDHNSGFILTFDEIDHEVKKSFDSGTSILSPVLEI